MIRISVCRGILLLFLLGSTVSAWSQTAYYRNVISSFRNDLASDTTDQVKFTACTRLAHLYTFSIVNSDSALFFIKLARQYIQDDPVQQMELYNKYVNHYIDLDPVKASQYVDTAKQVMLLHGDDVKRLQKISLYHQEAMVNIMIRNYPAALEGYQRLLSLARPDTSIKIQVERAYNYANMADLLVLMGDTVGALVYMDSSIATYWAANADSNYVSYAYANKALILEKCQRYEEALTVAYMADAYSQIYEHNTFSIVSCLYHLGRLQEAMEKAYDYINSLQTRQLDPKMLEQICAYGQMAARQLGNKEIQLFLMEKQIEQFEKVLSSGNNTLRLTEYIEQLSNESKELVIRQKDQELELRNERSRRQRTVTYSAASGFAFTLLLAFSVYKRLQVTRQQKTVIEKEKARSEELLLNILPEKIALELKETGRAEAREIPMVSVLFTDFKSFTEVAEQLNAQELVREINIYFEMFDKIVEKYHIEKIKTIGDSYMAAGGLPVPFVSSVKATVLAGLEMQDFIQYRKQSSPVGNNAFFDMRLGIHTGPVVAGIVGIKKFQYDVWGDTVNTASRLESVGEPGKVNISASTYEAIKNDPDFTFTYRGMIAAKGKGELAMWYVERSSS